MALLETLGNRYSVRFDKYEQLRNAGSTSYALFPSTEKYFLRVIKPALFDTAITGA